METGDQEQAVVDPESTIVETSTQKILGAGDWLRINNPLLF